MLNARLTLHPSSLFNDLGYYPNSWGLRNVVLRHMPRELHEGAMELKDPDNEENHSIRAVMQRWGTPDLRETHSRLMDQARTCKDVEEVEAVLGAARERLSRGAKFQQLREPAQQFLDANPAAAQALAAIGGATTAAEESELTAAARSMTAAGPLEGLLQFLTDMLRLREDIRKCAACAYGKAAEAEVISAWNDVCPLEEVVSVEAANQLAMMVPWVDGVTLSGQMDGYIAGTATIVEIKCRTARFSGVRDNERLQMHAYMFMHGTRNAVLVEGKLRRGRLVIQPTRVPFDQGYWDEVTRRASRVVELQQEIQHRPLFRSVFFSLSLPQQKQMLANIVTLEPAAKEEPRTPKRARTSFQ